MDNNVSPNLQKWVKKCVKKEFGTTIQKGLEQDEEYSEIARRIIQSEEMSTLLNSMKAMITEQYTASKSSSIAASESRPETAFSFASLESDDWNSVKSNDEQYNNIIDKISYDKPVHVRLAGYEILLKSELSSLSNSSVWDLLQKTLMDGLTDESRPVFEASLQVHAKLLTSSQSHHAYTSLLNAFNAQYHSQKLFEMLPTLISGINFKLFLHERLFRITQLIIHHQAEVLKGIRNIDKAAEEMIEQFIIFLSTHEFGNSMQPKTMNILNIISVLEPCANWSNRWILSFGTRKIFLTALGKSQSLLQHIMQYVKTGLEETLHSSTVSICDDPVEVCINGNTIETATFLHCLCFASQLYAYEAGRTLLSEAGIEASYSLTQFLVALLKLLNKLSLEPLTGVYDTCHYALKTILEKPKVRYDIEFYHVGLCDLLYSFNDPQIPPHTLDVMSHMLDIEEGSEFLISTCKDHSGNEDNNAKCPASVIIISASNKLKQPFSIMNTENLLNLFNVIEKLFNVFDAYKVVQPEMEKEFYPAITHFYKKLDRCFFENESKAQQINSSVKKLLLKIVSIPFGLRALIREPLVFDELIRGSITPLRSSWTSTNAVHFISSAAFFHLGYDILADLAPHALTTLVATTCKSLEDRQHFYDPWDNENVDKLLHIFKFFSLNLKCLSALMMRVNESQMREEQNYPTNLAELFCESINSESEFHYLGLLSLDAVIWNLNIFVYLVQMLNFQNVLLELQKTENYVLETEDESDTQFIITEEAILRHKILSQSYFIRSTKEEEDASKSEEYDLVVLPPVKPETRELHFSESEPDSELHYLLQESKTGLLDANWVIQVRGAYAASEEQIKNMVIIQLIDQMQKAIPTAEWVENFQWPQDESPDTDFWFPEEIHAIDIVLYYAEQNEILENTAEVRQNLQRFINASYTFIQYQRPKRFEGFDWFLSTIYIVCDGDLNRCKTIITQLIQFPSTVFLWPNLGKVIDAYNNEECGIQFAFMQLVEGIISNELPSVKFALKNAYGTDWSMICNVMLSQCFWGILPWSEIVHFLALCVLYTPDYIVYYCVSLLHHCQKTLLENITNGKLWPQLTALENYTCRNHIAFMDILNKRHGSKVLPKMSIKESDSEHET